MYFSSRGNFCRHSTYTSSSAIVKLGQRIPLAYRFSKMLEDLVTKRCGEGFGSVLRVAFPRSVESNSLQTFLQDNTYNDLTDQVNLRENLHEPGSFLSLA